MAATQSKALGKLARLTLDLKAKWALHAQLLARVQAVEQLGMVMAGERDMLDELDGLLQQATAALGALENGSGPGGDVTARLGELEAIAADARWEFAGAVSAELAKTEAAQRERAQAQQEEAQAQREKAQALVSELQKRISAWSDSIRPLVEEVAKAANKDAPVRAEISTAKRLDATVKAAERDLRDGQVVQVGDSLRKLEEELGAEPGQVNAKLQELLDGVKKKVAEVELIARQADLLLIRSPLPDDRYRYTLFLRTPRDPGQAGIDIQDESTVVTQDHTFVTEAMKEITKQVNAGLVRSFKPPPTDTAGATGTEPARSAGEVGGSGPDTGAAPTAAGDTLRLRVVALPTPQAARPARELIEEIGDLIYRLVVPEGMQRFLTEARSSLIIRTNDVELPWELMRVQGQAGPETLCLERPVARMPAGRAYPRRETTKDREGKLLRFLLIYSDPDKNLPAAGREIERIASGLPAEQVTIDTLMPDEVQGNKLNKVLIDADYDVIHYAGHAFFDANDADLSGLVLKGSELFFAQKVRRLLEGRPLVFLNACESGRTAKETEPQQLEGYLQKPAGGIASAFIYGGAKNCIGSIWPVYDAPAAEFAIFFYRKVIEGYMVGEALRQARRESRAKYPEQITWASYVLYGNPTATFAL